MRPSASSCRPPTCIAGLAGAILVAGCATTTPPSEPIQAPITPEQHLVPSAAAAQPIGEVPVVRQGRYTLIELVPEPAQRDLMQQVVEVVIPPDFSPSVGDGMRHALQRTGYRLCEAPEAGALYALPLPAAHLRLGPLILRDALLVLAGPAWDLSVDDVSRQVCFKHRAAAPDASPTPPGTVRTESIEHTDAPGAHP